MIKWLTALFLNRGALVLIQQSSTARCSRSGESWGRSANVTLACLCSSWNIWRELSACYSLIPGFLSFTIYLLVLNRLSWHIVLHFGCLDRLYRPHLIDNCTVPLPPGVGSVLSEPFSFLSTLPRPFSISPNPRSLETTHSFYWD